MSLFPQMFVLLASVLPGAVGLPEQDRHDLRCAAAFAVTAQMQVQGDAAALALPPLGLRGRRYFGVVGERIAAQTGLSGEAMHDLLVQTAREVAKQGAVAVAKSCLNDLDQVIAPRPAPDALTCHALLGVYAQVLIARDPADALGATLARESAALAQAAQALMQGRGLDAAGQASAIARERARIGAALHGAPDGIDADDFAQCRALARARAG